MGRVFFRVLKTRTIVADDFKSQQALGMPLRDPTMEREWAEGVSVLDTIEAAKRHATKYGLGHYVVAIEVPDDGSIEVKRTGRNRHHYTVYASPDRLLRLVSGAVVPVEE